MDPFDRLPCFVLQNILSNLADLPSLYRLHNASRVVAAFLHENNGRFAVIVDAIIGNPTRERGLLPHVQHAVRLLVLVWTRASDLQPRQANDEAAEPLEGSYTDILSTLRYVRERFPQRELPMEKIISRSTPSAILCQLLVLITRLRRIAHACFHSMISRCLKLPVEHLPKKTKKYINTRSVVDRSQRPQGIPYVPLDIGPATWFEEQRLLHGLLCIVLFYELRKTHAECSVITTDGQPAQTLLDDNVEGFWKTMLWMYNDGQVEQITTLLQWLDEQAGGRGTLYSWLLSRAIPEQFSHCCGRYTSMTEEQWNKAELDTSGGCSSQGTRCLWQCSTHNLSPLRCVRYSAFRPYCLVFWDGIRLDALGFPGPNNLRELFFAWSSILSEEEWDEILRLQPVTPRYDEFGYSD